MRQAAHQQRLGEPRNADEQAVTPGEQTDEQQIDDLLLTDHVAVDLGEEACSSRSERLQSSIVVGLQGTNCGCVGHV